MLAWQQMKLQKQKGAKINKSLQIRVKSLIFFPIVMRLLFIFLNNLIKERTKLKEQSITSHAEFSLFPWLLLTIHSQEAHSYQPLLSTMIAPQKRCFPEQGYRYIVYGFNFFENRVVIHVFFRSCFWYLSFLFSRFIHVYVCSCPTHMSSVPRQGSPYGSSLGRFLFLLQQI